MKSGKKSEINRTVFPLKKFKEIIVKILYKRKRKRQTYLNEEGIEELDKGIIYDISRLF